MKKTLRYSILCVSLLCLLPQLLIAKTGYVSDLLLLTFREGPGTEYAVKQTLKSGTRITIINEENGFYNVTLDSEETGWVDKKFIIFDTPKAIIIQQLESKINTLERRITTLQSRSDELKNQYSSSTDDNVKKIQTLESDLTAAINKNKTLSRSLQESSKKYDTLVNQSKNIQSIITENETLTSKNETLTASVADLNKKNRSMFKVAMIKWFVAGVGTLLIGWILGRNISTRRRSSSLLD